MENLDNKASTETDRPPRLAEDVRREIHSIGARFRETESDILVSCAIPGFLFISLGALWLSTRFPSYRELCLFGGAFAAAGYTMMFANINDHLAENAREKVANLSSKYNLPREQLASHFDHYINICYKWGKRNERRRSPI